MASREELLWELIGKALDLYEGNRGDNEPAGKTCIELGQAVEGFWESIDKLNSK